MKRLCGFGASAVSVVGIVVAILLLCFAAEVTQVAAQEVPGALAAAPENEQEFQGIPAEDLLREAQAQGSVPIIVKLRTAFRAEGELFSAQDISSQRAAIAQEQDQLLVIMGGHRLSNMKRFTSVPYMAMTVDDAGLEALRNHPAVVHIFKDEKVFATLAQSVPLIRADDVWAAGFTGTGWAIAILDTGVDTTHVFLDQGKVVSEACYSTTDASLLVSSVCPNGQSAQLGSGAGVNCPTHIDGCDHGTHVAGIAAGKDAGTTAPHLSGVAQDASIIAIQVFSRLDDFSVCGGSQFTPCAIAFTSDVGRGLERVYELRSTFQIAAVNMSLGGGGFTSPCDALSPLTDFIRNLRSVNIASVVSSGNNGFTNGISNPACISSAISVGNTTKTDVVNSSSNSADFLSLLAPGTDIVSSVPGNGQASFTGTSMAAPHVAGALALLRQAKPSASVDEILSILRRTGVPITDARNNITKPRIDVKAAFDLRDSIPRENIGIWVQVPGGGFTPSAPATTVLNGNLGLFVRGIDDHLYVNWLLTNNQWTGWTLVPGGGLTPSTPAATVLNGNLELFVRGIDDRLYVNWLLTNNQWTGWTPVPGGGLTPSAPTATVLNGNLGLFVQGLDSRLYVNWLLTNNQWTGWAPVPGGGLTPSAPTATVLNGNLGLFVQGLDSRLYVNWLLTNNQWTGWAPVPGGGFTPSAPAATVLNGNLGLFVQGLDSRLYVNWLLTNNQWTNWAEVPGGGFTPSAPAAIALEDDLGLFVRGIDDRLYVNWLLEP